MQISGCIRVRRSVAKTRTNTNTNSNSNGKVTAVAAVTPSDRQFAGCVCYVRKEIAPCTAGDSGDTETRGHLESTQAAPPPNYSNTTHPKQTCTAALSRRRCFVTEINFIDNGPSGEHVTIDERDDSDGDCDGENDIN
ncbi:hypothetical protein ACLKA7_013478 [Drosophila subpalustris]